MKNFVDLYGQKSWAQILSNNTPVSLLDPSLHWLDVPDQSFIEYVTQRPTLPFDGIPPNDQEYKRQPTYMIAQVHRLWITLQALRKHWVNDSSTVLLDIGAFPFSLDIIMREFLNFSGQIKATANLPISDEWQTELKKRDIETFYANLDPYVTPNIPDLPNRLRCEDNSVDFVLFAHVIEHLYHPLKLFEEAYRTLKPGGKILVSTDNAFMLQTMLNLCYLQDFLHEPVGITSAMAFHAWRGHNRFFSGKDLATMLEKVGFEVLETNFLEVFYNSFIEDYFYRPTTHIPKWRADILTEIPQYRNEVIIIARKGGNLTVSNNAALKQEKYSTPVQPPDNFAQPPKAPTYAPPANLLAIFSAPAEQLIPERLIIYSLIYALKPRHCLEIGTHWGGSASIICSAMDDIDQGRLVCVDPQPLVAPETWEKIKHRADLLRGASPDILPQARDRVEAPFDFVLIDGDHSYEGVLRDIEGVLPYLANQAYLLFHDSHYYEIREAIGEALIRYPSQLHDAGSLSSLTAPENREVNGQPVEWGGLRLLRFTQNYHALPQAQTQEMHEQLNKLQRQLRLTQEKLSFIENTRTWRFSSSLAYSPVGRFLSRLVKPFWR